jgi:glycosyltransferase involved in cell wall biosynthesis
MTLSHATRPSAVSIGFVWEGLPMYAARELRALAAFENLAVTVVGSRPPFSTVEIDRTSVFPIHWYDAATDTPSWADVATRTPDIVFSTGWAFPLCKRFATEARQQGRAVVCMADNRRRHTFRQLLGAVRFRLGLRQRFDRFFVPGRDARSLMRFFGVPDGHVREGLYGADPALFTASNMASRRSKLILFVGQMIGRKGVDVLLEGFRASGLQAQGWRLRCIGDGPLAAQAAATPGCEHLPFCDAAEVARHLGEARVFILPSRNDNWGVALHEAALSRCVLAASSAVGATRELMPEHSPLKFAPGSAAAIRDALQHASLLSDAAIDVLADATHARACDFGPSRFAREVAGFVTDLTGVRLTAGWSLQTVRSSDTAEGGAAARA